MEVKEKNEEEKSFALRWYKVRNKINQDFGKRPDINAMLFIIGMNEVGVVKENWEKEDKQNLMHVAVCKLLSKDGYYIFDKIDEQGWPHYIENKEIPKLNIKEQEELLKIKIVEYLEENM
jgi:hypothetical protein